ncbi:FAD-dependent oxidoreductase [Halobacillus sp. Marseille-Q1614]|uniref:FAD-dependent oxidoreductase n=1 Tax=Halobacillus sp. Marseille-Q1614 TaxID=2709134 RepID=UPI0015713454|nr:FAD-dependent oxidoreductase [Halobacillus sp. Marseille-Q1614]
MNNLPRQPRSMWRDFTIDAFPKLNEDIKTDVTVVGGGITGITTAYMLVKQGYNVVLLEAGRLVEGTTGYTTAKISSQHDLIYSELIKTHGEEKAKLYYEANEEGLALIDQIRNSHNIDCDFSFQDAFLYANSIKDKKLIKKEAGAYQKLGVNGGWTNDNHLPYPVSSAAVITRQAQFHPVKYLRGLIQFLKEKNTPIYENTRVENIDKGDIPIVTTRDGHKIESNHVVMASHYPFNDVEGLYFGRLHVERSYSIAVKTNDPIPEGMHLSTGSPKRSLRSAVDENGEQLLLIGGEGHTSGQVEETERCYENLLSFARKHWDVTDVPYRWSSQDLTTLDQVPYIGPVTETNSNIYVATGFSKWGMTNGTIAAKVISDQISHVPNKYEDLFRPSRFNAAKDIPNFTIENLDVAKEFLKGKLNRKDIELESIKRGDAAVVSYNGKKAGAYKDHSGHVTIVDTSCTHMGCDVAWNEAENSWDCPCHGSRFTTEGEVIEGPAVEPLETLNRTAKQVKS